MRHWPAFVAVSALSVGVPAHAAPSLVGFELQRHGGAAGPAEPPRSGLPATINGEDWSHAVAEPGRHEFLALAASDSTSIAVALSGQPQIRVELELQALAGHRSFDTMSTGHMPLGWKLSSNGNALGVGTTGSFGVRLSATTRLTPFVALDYNRIDSARYVNVGSPRPFTGNNADTGFTGTLGAVVSHRFGAERKLRAIAFGAIVAATSSGARPREYGSVGARFADAIGNSDVDASWGEAGVGVNYRLTRNARLNGVLLQTINRMDGEAVAAKLGLQIVL